MITKFYCSLLQDIIFAKASWCQRESWHHLRYMAHIVILWVIRRYWGHKV